MAKTSGGVRGSTGGGKSYTAYSSIRMDNGNSRIIERSFSTQLQANAWLQKVTNRFSGDRRGVFAEWGQVENRRGEIITSRDFAREFATLDARRFRRGYR